MDHDRVGPAAVRLGTDDVVVVGQDGWLFVDLDPDLDVRVHLAEIAGELQIRQVWISGEQPAQPLKATVIRDLPIARLQASLQSRTFSGEIRNAWSPGSAPDLRPEVISAAEIRTLGYHLLDDDIDYEAKLVIDVPSGPRDDIFYAHIQTIYGLAAQRGETAPAKAIATANNLPVTTVHRWLKEARRRQAAREAQRIEDSYRRAIWDAEVERRLAAFDPAMDWDTYYNTYGYDAELDPIGAFDDEAREAFVDQATKNARIR